MNQGRPRPLIELYARRRAITLADAHGQAAMVTLHRAPCSKFRVIAAHRPPQAHSAAAGDPVETQTPGDATPSRQGC